ncbi:thermonuclease family protein [Chryseobacterium wangxinyae]|uniref:thermonuclease family protein n=1 Tax=Chryseobacterium sp. CY350 TaxID=2997336 RepID=UPI002270B8AE|nr:thermonuclease family protein [Chryseobacterium sp. CY350]MCY0977136.1 thermonuclease family protein [Chryseobacterium sp. CY350]WBZ97351.1 thermonuclease family protein [Chryseobacterium sp. CY350]
MDCPESGQSFGKHAKQFTSSQVFGKNIEFYEINKDRYGRTIAKIFYDNNKYLSEEIIKAGYGWWYYKYSKNNDLEKYQNIAKEQKLGIWSEENAIAPWDYRISH